MLKKTILYNRTSLLPQQWSSLIGASLWTFNPSILRWNNEWIFAYRVVGVDQKRRIAVCKLNDNFQIIRDTAVPFSDLIKSQKENSQKTYRDWFADPRLYMLGGKTYLYWNSGWHEPQNAQYLQEFDPIKLVPVGEMREFKLKGARQALEKNWSLFGDGPFYAVYSVHPHRVLEFDLTNDTGPIEFTDVAHTDWNPVDYVAEFGKLRGGAPPVKYKDAYYSICHSLYSQADGLHYVSGAYCFRANFPHEPLTMPIKKLALDSPYGSSTLEKRLNPAVSRVIYPCGAALDKDSFVISYGINDELCAISIIPWTEVTSSMTPVTL